MEDETNMNFSGDHRAEADPALPDRDAGPDEGRDQGLCDRPDGELGRGEGLYDPDDEGPNDEVDEKPGLRHGDEHE